MRAVLVMFVDGNALSVRGDARDVLLAHLQAQHTSANVSIRQHARRCAIRSSGSPATWAYVGIREHT